LINARLLLRQSKGLSSAEIVADIVRANSQIASVEVVSYREGPNWNDLVGTIEGKSLAGLKQDEEVRTFFRLTRSEVLERGIQSLMDRLRGTLIGIVSRVNLSSNKAAHIPMMDFKCEISNENLQTLIKMLRSITIGPGYLLESGRSYHFFATQLISEEEWRTFLGRCLLMSGYSDDRYIGHQLVDGHCVLRLSGGNLKERIPTVVAEIG